MFAIAEQVYSHYSCTCTCCKSYNKDIIKKFSVSSRPGCNVVDKARFTVRRWHERRASVLDTDDTRASASQCEHVSIRDARTTLAPIESQSMDVSEIFYSFTWYRSLIR